MAKTDNLTDFLTDLADGIRAKTGETGTINPQDFRDKIEGIETGGSGGGLEFKSSASGCIPEYDHGYAVSTLTLDSDMFTSGAVGELVEE